MNKIKYIKLTKKELLNINGGNIKFTSTNASYYPMKWGKSAGKWIISKIK
ncbi:hypothetical protein [Bacillus pseudomycoides]